MKLTATRDIAASPEVVYAVLADPHRHVATLPDSVSGVEVHDSGEISCTISAMGRSERMRVRRTVLEPPRRVVEERVDGGRKATTEFLIEPATGGSRVRVTADVQLPMLVGAVARGPIEQGLAAQLAGLEREATA